MRISEGGIRRIIRQEIILEAARRLRASLVPGEWDPELGDKEELQDLERQHFGGGESSLTALAQALFVLYWSAREEGKDPAAEDIASAGRKHGFNVNFMGSGASRATFSIGSDLVMKVNVQSAWAARMNKDDYRLGIDTSLRQIAPRAYVHGGGFSGFDWVILERVRLITRGEQELPQFFKCSLLVDPGGLAARDKAPYWKLVLQALDPEIKDEVRAGWYFEDLILPKGTDEPLTMGGLRADLSRYSPAFRNLDRVIRKYGVAIDEIREDNLGIGSDGRLVLLDSSIF
jgi:hypothetical protein